MRPAWIVGNWKMHGSIEQIQVLLQSLCAGMQSLDSSAVQVLVCPPTLYLHQAADILGESKSVALGAQNLCAQAADEGAYTGEISAQMLTGVPCTHVLVGHSERRQYYAESDAQVAEKACRALERGIQPIICIGETLAQREAGQTLDVIYRQLDTVLTAVKAAQQEQLMVAYEPVWAIGSGLSATPAQAQEVHAAIRAHIAATNSTLAENAVLLYGGSVKAANAGELLAQTDIDGVLVGGASLHSDEFLQIIQAA